MKRGARTQQRRPVLALRLGRRSVRIYELFFRKNSFESPRFILIVQHHDRHDPQPLFAGMTLRHFALQILQKAIREMILRALAPGIFLVPRTAVGTDEFYRVLLRIAVQSSPTRAAHTYRDYITPLHRVCPP